MEDLNPHRTIERKSTFLDSMKKKHETKQVDDVEKPKFDMASLNYTDMPERMSIIGGPGEKSSAKPLKKDEQYTDTPGEAKNMANMKTK